MEAHDQSSLLRIIDVNLNRVAEALRTVEDICRLHWNLRGFAMDLKALRHGVLAAIAPTSAARIELLAERDIEGDVGRDTHSPTLASDPVSIACRNLERGKEALRTLEEACRVVRPRAAGPVEQLRYRLYALEKGLLRLAAPMTPGSLRARLSDTRICLLATSSLSRFPLTETVARAIRAGVDVVQLREKNLSDQRLLENALALREITASLGAIFVVNDRPDIAHLASADGVHLGQEDLSVNAARRILGPAALVGRSTHSVEQARAAQHEGADYLGAGPMFPTTTKDAGPLLGPTGLQAVLGQVDVPTFAIGGINAERAREIALAGGKRVAVASAILGAADPTAAVEQILQSLSS